MASRLSSLVEEQIRSLIKAPSASPYDAQIQAMLATDPTAGIRDYYGGLRNQVSQQNAEQIADDSAMRGFNPGDRLQLKAAAELDNLRMAPLMSAEQSAIMDAQNQRANLLNSLAAREQASQESRLSLLNSLAGNSALMTDDEARRRGRSGGGGVAAYTPYSGGGPRANPFDGLSSTGSISGGPSSGSGWDPRLGSERGIWDAPEQPTYGAENYETAAQAAERQAQNPRSANFDYSGAGNTGGHLVPGIPLSGPSVSNLQGGSFAGAQASLSFTGGNSGQVPPRQPTPAQGPSRLTSLNQTYTPQAKQALASQPYQAPTDYYSNTYRQ